MTYARSHEENLKLIEMQRKNLKGKKLDKQQEDQHQPEGQRKQEKTEGQKKQRKQEAKEQVDQQQSQAKVLRSKVANKKRRQPSVEIIEFLYDTRDSHPIIEYLPSKEDSESATLTPSFVLEVTWPRIIQFYHPSSPRCQALQPIYVALARGIKRRSSRLPVEFHAVNCGMYREVCEQGFNVKSVPTIIGLRSGRIEGTEISLPGNMDGKTSSKGEQAKDIELKVEYLAHRMGIPLDILKKGHAGAAFARPMGIDGDLEEASAVRPDSNFPGTMSYESSIPVADQVFHDAKSSFFATLTSSLYSQFPHGSALPPHTARALAEFLDLIRWAFPPETTVHDLAEDLKLEFVGVSMSEDDLLKVIGRHMDLGEGVTWSTRCGAQKNGGYSCGLWSLLHILSIGVAERHLSVVGDAERVSVTHAGQVMRTFIDKFFVGCNACRESWIEIFDEISGNNDHSVVGSPVGGIDNDWRNLAIWVWKIHNRVTIIRQQSAGKGYYHKQKRMASTNSLWPSKQECSNCWLSLTDDTGFVMNMDSYDRDELYNHLKKIYWPEGVHNNRLIVLDRWSKARRAISMTRLRDRMGAHEWPISVVILHILAAYLIARLLFPRWTIQTLNRMCLCIGCYSNSSHGRKHKKKKHVEQSSQGNEHRNSDKSGLIRYHSHQPVRYKTSSHRSRQSSTHERSVSHRRDNRREESRHQTKCFHGSHHERHGEPRLRSGSGSRSNKHHFNHLLEL